MDFEFQAVVFDMDGVIFDTEKLYRRFQMEEGGIYNIPDDLMKIVCDRIAGSNKYDNKITFEKLVGRGIDYFEYRDKVITKLDNHIEKYGVELKSGAREILEYLKDKNIKIGLATSTIEERAKKNLIDNNIYDFFDELVYGDMIANGKPKPDIYLKACEMLDVLPEKAIAVEDSINGIISAGTAGLYPVMVIDLIKPNDDIKPYAKQIYDNIIEIKKLI